MISHGAYFSAQYPAEAEGSGFDPDAQAFIDAAGITDETQQTAINTLVLDLKSYSLWAKMHAVYPFVGGTATTHKYNLVNPVDSDAAFRLTFNGGYTHDANGITGNGTNTYALTHISPVADVADDVSAGVYNKTGVGNSTQDYGSANGGGSSDPSWTMLTCRSVGTSLSDCWIPNARAQGNVNTAGYYFMTRNATNYHLLQRNGSQIALNTSTYASPTRPTPIVALNGQNRGTAPAVSFPDGYSNRNYPFAFFGQGLTSSELTDMYTAASAFNTTLGR